MATADPTDPLSRSAGHHRNPVERKISLSPGGFYNGADTLNGYGDPTLYDGPERFRNTYRHIIQLARDEGATNITWVFHVNYDDVPNDPWNCLEQYYPGDQWIDWIGVSVYGAQKPTDTEWLAFRELMDGVYPRLTALGPKKPIVLLEFGATSGNPLGDQAVWAENALKDLNTFRWQRVIGFSWWNEAWVNSDGSYTDMRVQDNPALAAAFQRQVGNQNQVLGRLGYSICLPLIAR